MNLGDRVLRPAPGPKPVGARLEVGLEDRLQHQLEGGLHDPVADRRDAQPTLLAAALGDQTLPDRCRPKAPGAQLLAELAQEPLNTQPAFDVIGVLPIHAGRARPSIGPHPLPRHHQRGRVTDYVVEVEEPPVLIVFCPPVQLALDPEYPRLGRLRPGPRRGAIQRRPPRLPDGCCKSAASLRHVPGFPRLGLLRRLRPTQGPTADSEPAHHRWAAPDGSHVHRRPIDGGGAQLCPCSLATSTPQTFPMASAPATKYRPRSRQPTRDRRALRHGPHPPGWSRCRA